MRQGQKMSRKRIRDCQGDPSKVGLKRVTGEPVSDQDAESWVFDRDLATLISGVLSSAEEQWRFHSAWQDVCDALACFLPQFQLHTFGSSVTGLAFKSSDIDLCLQVPQPPQGNMIKVLRKALTSCGKRFSHVVAVRWARVPIVKFRHAPSGLSGDISFSSLLAVFNSNLIKYLVSLDPRVLPLLVLVKHWARVQGVANTDGVVHNLSSYALAILALFFLQTCGVLPSVAFLQQHCPQKVYQEGWECSFTRVRWFSQSPAASLYDLATGFFAFYAAFDFGSQVICPLLGRAVPRAAFRQASTLPAEMAPFAPWLLAAPSAVPPVVGLQLERLAVCVQDPFVLDHNLARGQAPKASALFLTRIAQAAAVCQTASPSSLLAELLVAPAIVAVISKTKLKWTKEAELPADQWVETVTSIVKSVVTDVLRMRLEPIALPVNKDGVSAFSCSGFSAGLLLDRRSAEVLLGTAAPSPVERQTRVSERLAALAVGPAEAEGPPASFVLRLTRTAEPAVVVQVDTDVTAADGQKAAKEAAEFLVRNLQRWVPVEAKLRAAGKGSA